MDRAPGTHLHEPARSWLQTQHRDAAQIMSAWIFVATRVLHALVYFGWNNVPGRFAVYVAGCVTLGVIWTRLGSALL
jgi:hypothetical protein